VRLATLIGVLLGPIAIAGAEEPHALLLITSPPLDGRALSDVLRLYLDGYSVKVEVAEDPAPPSLPQQLEGARTAGEERRALAVVRLVPGEGRVEIQLTDRVGDKVLLASIARPGSDVDLYRTVALKIESMLRAALYEEVGTPAVQASPALVALVAAPPPSPTATPGRAFRLRLGVAYTLMVFPEWRLVGQGLSVDAAVRAGPVELVAGGAFLTRFDATAGDVSASLQTIPLWIGARAGLTRGRVSLLAELDVELLVNRVQASSATAAVAPPGTYIDPALGAGGVLLVRIVGPLQARFRAAAAVLLSDERFEVRGAPLFGLGRSQVTAEAGLTLGLL
jgi:hypothetical protein